MNYPLSGYQGKGFGANIGRDARQFVEDRRDDKRFDVEQKQMGLQEKAIEAKTADIGRQQETAQYDKDYELYKRDMSRGIQQFAMDPVNYQDAVDTANRFYGSEIQITHRKDPATGEVKYDFTGKTKDGEPMEKYGQTKADLGAMLNMSMHPANWLDRYEQSNIASKAAAASAQHDIDKIDRKGMWDSINEKIKAGAKGADTGLKFQKQAWSMAASQWGTLGDDGTFTFGDTYGADYAANTAHYAATLAQHGGKKFNGDVTAANQHALTKVKSLKNTYDKKLQAENPEMDEEDRNLLVKLYVDGEVRKLTEDVTSKGAASAATPEDRQRVVTENSDDIHKQMRDAQIPEQEIQKVIEENGGTYDGGPAGAPVTEAAAADEAPAPAAGLQEPGTESPAAVDTSIPEADMAVEEQAPAAPAEAPQQLAQAGDVGVDTPVSLGPGVKPVTKKRQGRGPSDEAMARKSAKADEGLDKEIKTQRAYTGKSYGGKEIKESMQLPRLRDTAAERVKAALAGTKAPVTSRRILTAALKSGKLSPEETKQVNAALKGETTMVAGK